MRTDKEKAKNLRLEGKSYREIKKLLGIPLATLSGWFKDDPASVLVFERLKDSHRKLSREKIVKMNDGRRATSLRQEDATKKEAERQFEKLKRNPLFIAGLFIYWGVGDKKNLYDVTVSNVDPGILAIFKAFLVEICRVDESKVKAWLLLYPDLDDEHTKRYWMATTGLKRANFTKSIIIQGRHKARKVSFGVCTVGVSNKLMKIRIQVWLRLMAQEMLAKKYNTAGMV